LEFKIVKNALEPRTTLGSLQRSPRSPSWTKGKGKERENGMRGRQRGRLEGVKEGKGGEGNIWERRGEGNGHDPSFSSWIRQCTSPIKIVD